MAAQVLEDKHDARSRLVTTHSRIDGNERVSGKARYGADWKVPGMLYARVLTSSIAHGHVRKIDTSKAMSILGVRAIITCLDDKTIWRMGDRDHERRALPDRVRFLGETIAAVAATSRKVAEQAVQAIEVEYEELPAVFTIEEARKEGAPKVWDEGNVTLPITETFGNVKECFDSADLILERDYSTPRVSRAQLEPPVSLAWWENDKLTVVVSTQTVHMARQSLSADLGIPMDKIRTITLFKGGGFGSGGASNYDDICARLAKKAGKPVMLEYSREQDFAGTHARWSTDQHLRVAVSKADMKLLAIELQAYCGIGAYVRFRPGLSYINGPDTYYSWDAWKADVYGVHTNTAATGYVRAPAGPPSCFSVETLVDEVAYEIGVNPIELRLRNFVVKPHGHMHLTSNGLEECALTGSEAFDWRGRWRPPPRGISALREKKLVGVGMAVASWHSLLGQGEAWARMTSDGILEVSAGVVDIGTGAKTQLAIIAANVLGVPVEKVRIVYGDSSISPFAIAEVGSMTTGLVGTAVREAAMKLKTRLFSLAYSKLGKTDLRIEDDTITNGRNSMKISDVISSSGLGYVEEKAQTNPKLPEHTERLSFAAHFAEVEIDSETGEVKVTNYVAAHDSGEIVNRLTAENQVQGGIVMGIGMALSENLLIDQNYGSVANPSFLNYRLPNHTSIPKIEVLFSELKDPYGPKSLGETSIVPAPPAIGNAIFNATGKRIRKLPFTPEKVLDAIES
ncbi:MAG: xanthine dehydrogenase family protein molybdopterin-binding subunit [Thaumarchaeota archaeon]|nr:xanthine dehydrogenase family protein molybdopterin-binding subunit [Nitrososphaerota archaeon]